MELAECPPYVSVSHWPQFLVWVSDLGVRYFAQRHGSKVLIWRIG